MRVSISFSEAITSNCSKVTCTHVLRHFWLTWLVGISIVSKSNSDSESESARFSVTAPSQQAGSPSDSTHSEAQLRSSEHCTSQSQREVHECLISLRLQFAYKYVYVQTETQWLGTHKIRCPAKRSDTAQWSVRHAELVFQSAIQSVIQSVSQSFSQLVSR